MKENMDNEELTFEDDCEGFDNTNDEDLSEFIARIYREMDENPNYPF